MQEDGQEERIHCMVIGQAHNDISGKGGWGWGWGNTSPHGIWRRALTQALPALLLPTRSDYTTRYGRPYGQHRMQCMAQHQQPCDHIGCAVSACPCNDITRHNRPAMIQRRYRMPSVHHIPTRRLESLCSHIVLGRSGGSTLAHRHRASRQCGRSGRRLATRAC